MMFSLPDFSVKRPVCVFICLVSLILFGVSSVFEMPLESTPEMNMPTMTIMTSYPDVTAWMRWTRDGPPRDESALSGHHRSGVDDLRFPVRDLP